MNPIPKPLLHKIIVTPLIGSGCLILGITMFIGAGDRTLLLLSGVLFLACVWKAFGYYRIAVKEQYEIISGTCVRILPQPIGKFRKVQIMDENGVETTLRLPKQNRFRIGAKYRLYFSTRSNLTLGGEALAAALSTDSFLGYEEIPETSETAPEENVDRKAKP